MRGTDVPAVRRGNCRDRLRRERAVGRRAGAVLRAGDQARKARLPLLPGRHGDDAAAGAAHRGEGIGQRPGGGGNGGRQVLGSSAAVPAGGDPGAGSGTGDRPGHVGWLGDASGRVAGAGGRGDATGSAARPRICKPTRRSFRCRCTTNAERITRRICGNTASREERRYSISAWGEAARVHRSFWGSGKGILQTDGYQAYDGIGGPKLVHVGCWAHARRKFVDAVKVNRDDAAAVQMVMRMDALFLVDRRRAAKSR